tara:strand:+ start:170 stop:895 length:726 start_codon:yes stop_codon:yes gene_type:complete
MITIPLVEDVPVISSGMNVKELKRFILKVYLCLFFQVMCFLLSISLTKIFNLREFYVSDIGRGILGISIFLSLIPIFITCFCEKYFTIFPLNYLLFFLFTFGTSYTIGTVSSFVKEDTLLLSVFITSIDSFVMTLIGLMSNWGFNISYFNQFLTILFVSLISISIFNIFLMSSFLQLFTACLGSILFSAFIIYDTKLITDKTYKVYKKEDFIIASINLYLDIVNLFFYILQILSLSGGSSN